MRFLLPVIVSSQLALIVSTGSFAATEKEDDFTIRPGVGMGDLHLGMTKEQINKVLGKPDGEYSMPGGIHAEYSQWKETDSVSTVRIFFDAKGKAFQIACSDSAKGESKQKLVTADGIHVGSDPADVAKKYNPLSVSGYHAKDGKIEYADNTKRGIAFEYTWTDSDDKAKKRLYAIIVHTPGKAVIADADEKPVKVR